MILFSSPGGKGSSKICPIELCGFKPKQYLTLTCLFSGFVSIYHLSSKSLRWKVQHNLLQFLLHSNKFGLREINWINITWWTSMAERTLESPPCPAHETLHCTGSLTLNVGCRLVQHNYYTSERKSNSGVRD